MLQLPQSYLLFNLRTWCLQHQSRTVFRHDLGMPLEPLLTTYCKWRGLDISRCSFLWLQFYMRLGLHDTGFAQGLDDGDHIHVFNKEVSHAAEKY